MAPPSASARHSHINVRRLRKHAAALQEQAELPRGPSPSTALFVDDDCIQQTPAADLFHERRFQCCNLATEHLTERFSTLAQLLVDENMERCHGHCTSEGIAACRRGQRGVGGGGKEGLPAISTTVFTWTNAVHDIPIGEHRRDGVD